MKKLSLILVFVFAAMAVFPVFAQDDPYADVDPTGQVIEFWYQHTRDRETAMQEIIADFNETNEWGIVVEGSYQGNYDEIFEKSVPVIGTADSPNIVVAYQNNALDYYSVNGLIDMNLLVDSPTWGLTTDEKADFFPGFYAQDVFTAFGGVRLGFPPNRSMEMMYYNADWLAELYEAGVISFEGAPVTPEQFREAACAAAANPFSKATGDTSLTTGYELSIDASRFTSWVFGFGSDVFDYETNEYLYTSEAAVNAMTFLQELYNDGCIRDVTEAYGDQTDFGQGVCLFTVGSSSGLPFYQSAVDAGAQFNWSVTSLPRVTEEPMMNVYGASVSIAKATPEEELASWLFIKYYTSPEVQARWFEASQYFPVRFSVAETMDEFFAANPAFEVAFSFLPYGYSEPPMPGYGAVRTAIDTYLVRMVINGEDVPTLLEELQDFSTNELADATQAILDAIGQ